jgi:CubicO group peptidase (beta-lactamase class C family)
MIRIVIIFNIFLAIFAWSSKAVFSQIVGNKFSANQVQKFIERKELESFLDKIFAEQMPKYHIPGAVFTLVKDGKIFFSKGYGYADLEKKKPVNKNETLFRAYSISKSFTATAVMQLVERGQLKLDEDVNKYLKRFKIKDSFAEPVTLADLMTHNAGFTDPDVKKQLAQGEFRELDLGKYLEKNLPPRSKAPGTFEYSNFGATLAGFIVEEVSGETFPNYVEKHIFKPLGMNHSTFLLPSQLSQKRLADFAYSYTVENGMSHKMPFEIADFSTTPAANLLTTGSDIAKFMIAHLQNGRYENIRILNEASAKRMHEPWLFSNSKPDTGYGFFWRAEKDGQRVLFHAGGYGYGNVNIMQLIPEYDAAFFLSFTHGGNLEKRNMRNEIASQIMNRYFPKK